MNDWFKTSLHKPTIGNTVLCFWSPPSGSRHPGCWAVATYSGDWHNPEDADDEFVAPDYWMLLPKEPELKP